MNENALALATLLIRNFDDAPVEREQREPDSNKYLAMASGEGKFFDAMHRKDSDLDYWYGEP